MEGNPYWPEKRIKKFRCHFSSWEKYLPNQAYDIADDYLEHHEFGLVAETIIDSIIENELKVPSNMAEELFKWCYEMDILDHTAMELIRANLT